MTPQQAADLDSLKQEVLNLKESVRALTLGLDIATSMIEAQTAGYGHY